MMKEASDDLSDRFKSVLKPTWDASPKFRYGDGKEIPKFDFEMYSPTRDGIDAQDRRLNNHFLSHYSKSTPQDVLLLNAYTRNASTPINKALAAGPASRPAFESTKHQDIHDTIMRMSASAPELPETVHVWSGISGHAHRRAIDGMQPGSPVEAAAHWSASLAPHVAHEFIGDTGKSIAGNWQTDYVAHITVPQGHRGTLYVGQVSDSPNENELLIPHKTKLIYHGHHTLTNDGVRQDQHEHTITVHRFSVA